MIASPFCLYCEDRIDPDEAMLVVVYGAARLGGRHREGSWVCSRPQCLARLEAAAREEKCELLQPQGIFDPAPRPGGLPSWVVWISRAKARADREASALFEAMYRPFTLTAR